LVIILNFKAWNGINQWNSRYHKYFYSGWWFR
jgi:hypothetical protein